MATSKEPNGSTGRISIEAALQIDNEGMTTASNLYNFLELDPTHFARWCKRNILNNKFATENKDYKIIVYDDERPRATGRPKIDYKITASFAKKIAMNGNIEKHEEIRKYFIACEQKLKIAIKNYE